MHAWSLAKITCCMEELLKRRIQQAKSTSKLVTSFVALRDILIAKTGDLRIEGVIRFIVMVPSIWCFGIFL
jgi:hypothetical protein